MRFNYRQRRYRKKSSLGRLRNPLFSKPSWQQYIIERLGTFTLLTILVVLLFIYILFYSPIFQITNIEISGPDQKVALEINEKFVRWQLEQRRLLIFRQHNILLFDTDWLIENIELKYSFATLKINKNLPHTLKIEFLKNSPKLIWQTNNNYYYIGENGIIASHTNSISENSSVPIIIEKSESADEDEKVDLNPSKTLSPGDELFTQDRMNAISAVIDEMETVKDFAVTGYSLSHPLSTKFIILTDQSYAIYFDISKSIPNQIEKLVQVLATKIKEQTPQSYIDLRIGDRVYIK